MNIKWKIVLATIVTGFIALSGLVVGNINTKSVNTSEISVIKSNKITSSKVKTGELLSSIPMFVYIKGAVEHPGIYQVTPETRLFEVINKAKGLTSEAETSDLNLSQLVLDQMEITVPHKGQIISRNEIIKLPINMKVEESSSSVMTDNKDTSGKINLNSADINELQKLNGIGAKKAQKIIDFRQSTGNFKSIEDLKNVPGFGQKTVDNLRDSICV